MAFSLSNFPPGTSLMTADGTPVILDANQQLVIQASGSEEIPGKESSAEASLRNFWQRQMHRIRAMKPDEFRHPELPLARIKKIMKLDEDVGMISSEAPVVLSKACEMFIEELTLRAWLHVEENKRRTLQRNDVATAVSKCDQFDFLIDIVPRDEVKPKPPSKSTPRSVSEVQYFVQQGGQVTSAVQGLPSVPVTQLQLAVQGSAQQTLSVQEGATLPVVINNSAGEIQQANLSLTAQQIEAIRQYISTLGIPLSASNQIVIQAPTGGGSQLQVSINPNQLQPQEASD
ncbi:nuclear transcription factor Y subunit gamma-like [Paramacrobiotus metropolitanus]|uniref:nuclear transcription factor Y subunit gamma-like n=1 Tax=Paramacrobiotus metropolitanus TaxID=2943436 RepID=UPI0024461544|nr:nuclear transcription factor Y subunit gamma-like [Paramacrobiotus metropolitanus]